MKPFVGLLYDSVSSNTGDIAIGIALQQQLDKYGIKAEIINPFSIDKRRYSTIIVGGGELLRDKGDNFYDKFRLKGKHILNGVGVPTKQSLGYLDDYKFISARSVKEAERIKRSVKSDVELVPCLTTLLEGENYEIPEFGDPSLPTIGIHLVPDSLIVCPDLIEIIDNIEANKLFIPFTHYNMDQSFMKSLPFNTKNTYFLEKLSPLELHSVIGKLKYTITSSLHASIFSYSQNVPFITLYQEKVLNYFKDRDLDTWVFKTQEEFISKLNKLQTSPPDMRKSIRSDRKKLEDMMNKFRNIISEDSKTYTYSKDSNPQNTEADEMRLTIEQLKNVVRHRDVLAHYLSYRYINRQEVLTEENNNLKSELSVAKSRLEKIEKTVAWRAYKKSKNISKRITGSG